MLAEMARQILHLLPELAKLLIARVVGIEAGFSEIARERVGRIHPLELMHHPSKPVYFSLVDAQYFSDFSRRALAAIRDDIRGHRRAHAPVPLVHVLNDAL